MQASGQSTLSSTTNSPTSFCQYFCNASLLFHILQTFYEQCPFDQKSINIVFTGLPVMCAFLVLEPQKFYAACFDISFLDCTESTMIHDL
jgi:hypothetical protein